MAARISSSHHLPAWPAPHRRPATTPTPRWSRSATFPRSLNRTGRTPAEAEERLRRDSWTRHPRHGTRRHRRQPAPSRILTARHGGSPTGAPTRPGPRRTDGARAASRKPGRSTAATTGGGTGEGHVPVRGAQGPQAEGGVDDERGGEEETGDAHGGGADRRQRREPPVVAPGGEPGREAEGEEEGLAVADGEEDGARRDRRRPGEHRPVRQARRERGRPGRFSPTGPAGRTRGACGEAQPVVTAVSSIRKPVARDESSVPVNLIVTVLPLKADRSRVRWV